MAWVGHVASARKTKMMYKILVRHTYNYKTTLTTQKTWEDNIETNLT